MKLSVFWGEVGLMESLAKRIWEVIGILSLMAVFHFEINGPARAGQFGKRPRAANIGEQPDKAVDDGSEKDLVPRGRQPGGSLADQVDPNFKGNRMIKDKTELRYKPTNIADQFMILEVDPDGPYGHIFQPKDIVSGDQLRKSGALGDQGH